jgi:hypothetical protein
MIDLEASTLKHGDSRSGSAAAGKSAHRRAGRAA